MEDDVYNLGEHDEPAAKRARRVRRLSFARTYRCLFVDKVDQSHHKNQLLAFCYCAQCRGVKQQKPRTIDDHRTRYPRQTPSPEPRYVSDVLAEHKEATPNRPNPIDIPSLDSPRNSPTRDLHNPQVAGRPHHSPARSTQSNRSIDSRWDGRGDTNGSQQPPSPHPSCGAHDADDADEDLEAVPEEPGQYPFNRPVDEELLGGYNVDADQFIFNDHDMYDDLMDNEELDQQNLENGMYDVDFGLPEDGGELPVNDRQVFQYPMEDELEDPPDDDPEAEDDLGTYYAAFKEPDLIRNAYIDAFVQKTLYGATHRALRHQLKAVRRTLASHPAIAPEDLAQMAQSIGTVERRLGVDTDSIITTYVLCPVCKRRYTSEYISEAEVDTCLNDGCSGVLFTSRRLASGSQRRVPHSTFPLASPIAWIRHMLNLAGVPELLQTWRAQESDAELLTAPVSAQEYINNLNVHRPIADICDGWGWRSTEAGLERIYNPHTGDVIDQSTLEQPVRFVSLPFGLSLSLNTDW
jgi:Zn-finger nucleic acid-binding protein